MEENGVDDVELAEDDLDIGDGAVAVTYRSPNSDDENAPHWVALFIQVDDFLGTRSFGRNHSAGEGYGCQHADGS